jgi:hypothetical protein
MLNQEINQLNPDITEIVYGKRLLKKLTIYPLSIGDQFKVTDLITELVNKLVTMQKSGKTSEYALLTSAIEILQENINKIFVLVTDVPAEESEAIINDMTNTQLVDLVDIIWSVNFEPALKKGKSLFEKGKSMFNSKNSLQDSSNPIPSTGSMTSTESLIDKED